MPQRRGRSPALSLCVPHRYKDGADSPTEDGEKPRVLYSLEFTFDADARVLGESSREAQSGRRLLGTNGARLAPAAGPGAPILPSPVSLRWAGTAPSPGGQGVPRS